MQPKAKLGNPVLWPLAMLLIAALLLVGPTGSASAGNDGNNKGNGNGNNKNNGSQGKCKKRNSNGSAKSSTQGKPGSHRKCGKRKPNGNPTNPPAPNPPGTPPSPTPPSPPAAAPAALAIGPTSADFGRAPHGSSCQPGADPNCPTRTFNVTNVGGSASGAPAVSIVELHNPEFEPHAAFTLTANACTAALAPGESCSITVRFSPRSNAGDQQFSSRLDVTASGSIASSVLSGEAN